MGFRHLLQYRYRSDPRGLSLPKDAAHNRKSIGSTTLDTKACQNISKTLISDYDYGLISTTDVLLRLASPQESGVCG